MPLAGSSCEIDADIDDRLDADLQHEASDGKTGEIVALLETHG
jgi:hypothetical protein